jgi:hypothetical protein
LDAADEGGLAIAERIGSVALFLFATAEFFPCAPCFLFGYLQLAPHFVEEIFGPGLVLLGRLGRGEGICSTLSFGFQLTFQICLDLLGAFLLGTSVEEPALELALGRSTQPLQFDYSMEQIGTRSGQVRNLASQLLAEGIFFQVLIVLLEFADPVTGETFPMRRECLPPFKSMWKAGSSWLLQCLGRTTRLAACRSWGRLGESTWPGLSPRCGGCTLRASMLSGGSQTLLARRSW